MRFKLRPSDDTFYEYFSKAATNLVRGTELLTELALPGADVQSISERLVEVEHDSDAITHELYNKINTSFITPFDREDIYRLGSQLDDIMDHLEAVGSLLYLYGLTKLPTLPREVHEMVNVLDQQAKLTASAMPRLKTMKDLSEYWVECNRLENEGDRITREAVATLFEGGIDPMVVIRWKDIFERLENAIDSTEKAAYILEGIVIKNS